jgi:F-type H+-transporting ATPase subunit delta
MNRLLEVYSRGLYDSLSNEGVVAVVEHFQNISNDGSVHGLTSLFKNKTVQKEEKLETALKLVGGDVDLEAFMQTLANNGRLDLLPAIFGFFVDYASRRQNNVAVKVTVNEEPNEEIKNRVSSFVSQNMGHNTPIKYEINKTMLGGVVLKYKDNEIDLSVDNKLNGLNSVLTN